MKKAIMLILMLMSVFLFASYAEGLTAKTCSYTMSVRYFDVPATVDSEVCLINDNAFPVTVSFEPSSNIADMIDFPGGSVELSPGEQRRYVPFTVDVSSTGTWTGAINLKFESDPEDDDFTPVTISSQIVITRGECETGDTKSCTAAAPVHNAVNQC